MKHELKGVGQSKEIKAEGQRHNLVWILKAFSPVSGLFQPISGQQRNILNQFGPKASKEFKQKNDGDCRRLLYSSTQHLVVAYEPSPICMWPRVSPQ